MATLPQSWVFCPQELALARASQGDWRLEVGFVTKPSSAKCVQSFWKPWYPHCCSKPGDQNDNQVVLFGVYDKIHIPNIGGTKNDFLSRAIQKYEYHSWSCMSPHKLQNINLVTRVKSRATQRHIRVTCDPTKVLTLKLALSSQLIIRDLPEIHIPSPTASIFQKLQVSWFWTSNCNYDESRTYADASMQGKKSLKGKKFLKAYSSKEILNKQRRYLL